MLTMQRSVVLGYCAWSIALIGMLGSLYFSEVLDLPPCHLCWYQRIALYPLVVTIAVGIVRKEMQYVWYSLPLALIGWLIAVYHNLIYYRIVPEVDSVCGELVSCLSQFTIFGFVSIPLLSLVGFTIIILCLYFVIKSLPYEQRS